MKAVILKLGCEGCGQELMVERRPATAKGFVIKLVFCSNGACRFHNQKFEPPTVELKTVE